MPSPDAVPRLARALVAVLITAMIASALFLWEPWPLTSFRLFSHLRHDEQTSWEATAVTPGGERLNLPLGGSARGLRGFNFVMAEFDTAGAQRRDELCRTWIEAAPGILGRPVVEVRLVQRRWLLSKRSGDRARPGEREPIYSCTSKGARVVG
jgi:hypothetical protein